MAAPPLLTTLLKDVSRSFYQTLRVLPKAIRPQIGLAYLLARTTDTIADTEVVPVAERLRALDQLRARILGQSATPLDFSALGEGQGARVEGGAHGVTRPTLPTAAERIVLERVEEALALLACFAPDDQQRIREVLTTITSGQELDLKRFGDVAPRGAEGEGRGRGEAGGAGGEGPVVSLRTDAELEDYTYRVAGCVGEFWTRMCRAHLFPNSPWDEIFMLTRGVQFGQGLQLVNILRDLPADLRKGRCYVPTESLATVGLTPLDLLEPQREPRFRPIYQSLLDRAQARLAAGWEYTLALPRGCARVRLACAWPILIGVRTLRRLRSENVLDSQSRIKISRTELRSILLRSVVLYPFPPAWRRMFAAAARTE